MKQYVKVPLHSFFLFDTKFLKYDFITEKYFATQYDAPPYSSTKAPVNMAGFMIEDLESGKVQQVHWNDVEGLHRDGSVTLLDVRTEGEYQRGHLKGFRNIPLDDLRERLDELDQNKPVYVNCQTGLRSYLACRLLTQYGFTCAHLSGGYSFYQAVTQERQTAQNAYLCGMKIL